MRRTLPTVILAVWLLMVLGLALWASPGGPGLRYRLLETQKVLPAWEELESGTIFQLAEGEVRYQELWAFYRLQGEAPAVDWQNEAVLFVGTGESGSCPLRLSGVELEDGVLTVRVAGPSGVQACTDDFTPRTFVVALRELPAGGLQVRIDGREARVLR